MTHHVIKVRDRRLTVCGGATVAGGINADTLSLDLDAEWEDLTPVLYIGPCDDPWRVEVDDGGSVTVPAKLLEEPGWLPLSVVGYGSDGSVRVTTAAATHALRVDPSGCYDAGDPYPDQPDLLGQLVAAGEDAEKAAAEAREAAALIPDGGEPGQVLTRTEDGSKWADPQGGGAGGTSDYELLSNLPTINGVTVKGDAESLAAYGAGTIPSATIDSICV